MLIKKILYTLKYNTNGGTSVSDQSYNIGSPLSSLAAAPSRPGYKFDGWFFDENCTKPATNVNDDAFYPNNSETVNVYAKWTLKLYKLNFQTNEESEIQAREYSVKDKIQELPAPTRLGYTFEGWYYDSAYTKKATVSSLGEENTTNFPENSEQVTIYATWNETNYTLKYDSKGGSSIAHGSYSIDSKKLTQFPTDDPTRDGYDFAGWHYDSDCTAKVDLENLREDLMYPSTTTAVTFYAKWTLKKYTITFHLNEGTGVGETKEMTCEDKLDLSTNLPTRENYIFAGWYADADFKGSAVTEIKGTTADRALYAKWNPLIYSISYDLAGGTLTETNPTNFDCSKQDQDVDLIKPTKAGYTFLGWADGGQGLVQNLSRDRIKAQGSKDYNYSLTAHWELVTYTVTYDVNVNGSKTGKFTVDTKSFPDPDPNQIPDGRLFDYWVEEETGQALSFPITKDISLTAKWEDKQLYATFMDGDQQIETKTFTVTSKLGEIEPLIKAGAVFEGWSITPNGKVEKFPMEIANNVTLYAVWTAIQYTVTLDLNGGKYSGSETLTYDYTNPASLPTAKDIIPPTGKKFDGWKWNNQSITIGPTSGGVQSDSCRKEAFTAVAQWASQSYQVIFHEMGGSKVEPVEYTMDKGIPAGQMPSSFREGYTFNVWEDKDGKAYSSVPTGITGQLDLYAKWEPKSYTITYQLNGGTNPANAPEQFTCEEYVPLPVPTKDYYVFAGWFTDGSFSGNKVEAIVKDTKTPQTFYAKWVEANYTIKFITNDGKEVPDLHYTYGSASTLKKSSREGYTFGGWYYDAGLSSPVGEQISANKLPTSGSETVMLYAKWNPIQYTITYNTYGGKILSGKVDSYLTGEEVTLPMDVKRDGFSFAGWYADDLLKDLATKISAGDYGSKTFYATWNRGFSVILSQPKEGVISVKQGDQVIASGTPLAKGTELTISAAPTTSGYVLKQLVINGQAFTTSPQTVTMGEANLIISAEFVASTKPTVSAPTITTDPDREKVDAETLVKVTLAKTDAASTLYYTLNDQQASPYSAPFVVDGGVGDTVTIRAIARREGYNDGITTRRIVFDGRLHLTFDLPAGVTATAPDGGAVVDAIVKGGTFEFKLQVDKNYFASTDSLQVMANDSLIKPGSSGVYRLYDQKGDVKVVVKGLKAYTCVVTLLQTEHGQIAFAEGEEESSRTIAYGTELTLQATADEDYKFSKWSTGSQQNPLKLTVVSDTTLSATFVHDYKAYQITLPEVEGVTAKPFTGYSTEVKRDGTFKFYLVIANGYHEEQLVVRADGEELVKNKGGYALYHITKNIRISVEGIARDAFALTLPPNVQAWKLATMEEAAKASLYAETTLLLQAMAPEGQRFLKWTDGSTENPRTATALDAKQLYPLFTTLSEIPTAKVSLEQTAGAGITGATSNLDVANLGDQLSVKVVVLPAYSQSEVRLLANGQSVEPQARLRAASEAKSYYYQVPVAQADVKLKVEGLRLNQYQLTVAESTGGRVEGVPSGKVTHGDTVSLTAKAAEGMTFVRWWDGNTLNPYPYPVTGDQTIRAYFVGESSPVDNESVTAEEVRVCSPTTGGLWVELPVPQDIWLWDSSGRLLLHRFESGTVRLAVPAGIYLLQCGMRPAFKVVVRQ
ncbi:InlB B-repeat-containing protein [Parabacteroides distasonis]|nr:InlB B-repeat-containing protein [Parabacteroides distasonis]